jgi:hypothetical protein
MDSAMGVNLAWMTKNESVRGFIWSRQYDICSARVARKRVKRKRSS